LNESIGDVRRLHVTTFVDPTVAFRMPIFFMRLVILHGASSFDSQNTNVPCSTAARIIRSALLRGLFSESPQGTPFPRRTSRSIGSSNLVVSCFPGFHPLINRIVNDNPSSSTRTYSVGSSKSGADLAIRAVILSGFRISLRAGPPGAPARAKMSAQCLVRPPSLLYCE
jgi:hypothetical protein